MGRPTRDRARDTRKALLDAALDLFAERGFHATSMRALASAVGVRESALYHYFPSKDALLAGVLADRAAARTSIIQDELRHLGEGTLEEVLTRMTTRLATLVDTPRERKMVRVILGVVGRFQPGEDPSLLHQMMDGPKRMMAQLFRELRRSGRIRDDVEFEIFVSHLMGPFLLATNVLSAGGKGPLAIPLKRFLRLHVAFMVQALTPVNPQAKSLRGRGAA